MKNNYEVRGDVTAIFIDSPKFGRYETLISTSDLERVKEFPNTWIIARDKNRNSVYVHAGLTDSRGKQKSVCLHRWITNAPKGMVVDHIDHNTLNNTASNLRIVTNAENQQNRKGAKQSNKSGVRGVSWHKKNNKWLVILGIDRERKYFGSFNTVEEAERVAIEARLKYMPYSQEAPL